MENKEDFGLYYFYFMDEEAETLERESHFIEGNTFFWQGGVLFLLFKILILT